MNNHNIISLFLQSAENQPHKIAFVQDKEEVSYLHLEKSVKRAAEELRKEGINIGDRVLVFIPMSVTLYKTVLSLFYIGAIPVFIDQWVGLGRLNACLKMVECRGVIAPGKFLLIGWLLSGFRNIKIKLSPPSSTAPHLVSTPAEKKESDTALITFTTGSTGQPKAADRTHGFLHEQHRALSALVEGSYERSVTLLPIVVLLNLAAGKTIILPSTNAPKKGKPFHTYLQRLLTDKKADAIIGSPSILSGIAKIGRRLPMKHVVTGGGPLYPDDALLISQSLSPQFGVAVYGSTEAEPISTIDIDGLAKTSTDEVVMKGLPLGNVHPGIQIAILPFDFSSPIMSLQEWDEAGLHNGRPGEIAVKGAHVLTTGYIDNQDAWIQTKVIVDRDVWHRTGDAGRIDASGKLFFLGRCAERIIHNGKEIFPVILSYILKIRSGVRDAAMLSKHQQLIIVIEKKDQQKEIRVKEVLADLGYDDLSIKYVTEIPKDPRHHTKTDYAKLSRLFNS